MNLLLVIPDGVGVRNFLLGNFTKFLADRGQCRVLHAMPRELLAAFQQQAEKSIKWEDLIPYRESLRSFLLRYCLMYAQMWWANTKAMSYNRQRPMKGSWRMKCVHSAARLIGSLAAGPSRLKLLDRWHCYAVAQLPEVQHYREIFQQIQPTVLFCSHQRPPNIIPPVLAARSLGIPTATFIFSWDNLTSKGRIAAPFDHYLVWSAHMRDELLRYYPDVSSDNVHIVGTPQFDPYADKTLLWSRTEFFSRIDADPTRPLLCYSGGDTGTCPEDHLHVRVLLDLIRGRRIRGNPQVLLRPAPVDIATRYNEVRRDYPELIYARPEWVYEVTGDWSRVIPLPEDVQFLTNLTHHADLNINVASTMTLDFALHDKPVVNIAFDVGSPPPFGVPLWQFFYQFEHYRPVVELGAARFARSRDELAEHVNTYLENPTLDREARRRLVELEVGVPIGQSSGRIAEVLKTIAAGMN